LVPAFPDKAREFVVTVGQGEIERYVALAYVRYLTDATDILEFLVGLNDFSNPVIQLLDSEGLSRPAIVLTVSSFPHRVFQAEISTVSVL